MASRVEAAKTIADATSPLVESLVKHQLNLRHMQKKAKLDKEIAQKKARAQREAVDTMKEASARSRSGGEGSAESADTNVVMDLMEKEDCTMCKKVLREIDDYSGSKREKALAEYGEMKATMAAAEESGEVKEFIEGTDVLEEAVDSAV